MRLVFFMYDCILTEYRKNWMSLVYREPLNAPRDIPTYEDQQDIVQDLIDPVDYLNT